MILPASYSNGFAPRDGSPLYPELWRGCVGAWAPCLGPTGLMLRDWSALRNHGTLSNMDAAGDWVTSSGRYALDFDGSNDYVQTTLVPSDGNSNMTFSCWCKYTAASQFAGLVYWRNGSFPFHVMAIGILANSSGDPGAKLFCQDNNSSTASRFAISASDYNDGKWHHVAAVRNSASMTLFVDGASVTVVTGTRPDIYHSAPVFIGSRANSSTSVGTFNGQIDDVQIYNRDLSAREIRLLASRRGIAYEMAPRRRSLSAVQFNRRRRLLLGASS